jgi:hypothetical protein
MSNGEIEEAEEWRKIPWAEHYEASTLGRVRRVGKTKSLRCHVSRTGYPHVAICGNGKQKTTLVHRIIVDTFLGGLPQGKQTNHINAIRSDNRLINLEIVTPRQNSLHKRVTGTMTSGEKNAFAKLDLFKVLTILTRVNDEWAFTGARLAKLYSVTSTTICDIRKGRGWIHVGSAVLERK